MNLYGHTPIEAALSVLGLNIAQLLTDFLFVETSAGLLILAVGFLLSLVKSLRGGRLGPFLKYAAVCVLLTLLLLPSREEGRIESLAQLRAGELNASELKDRHINYHRVPTILSFLSQWINALSLGAIQVIDQVVPAFARYQSGPFEIQKNALRLSMAVEQGIKDRKLRQGVSDFLYTQYLPALGLQAQPPNSISVQSWPGHPDILLLYPTQARQEWEGLRRQILQYLSSVSYGQYRRQLSQLAQVDEEKLDELVLKAYLLSTLSELNGTRHANDWTELLLKGLTAYPLVAGWIQAAALAAFPLTFVAFVLTQRNAVFFTYLKIVFWTKLLSLAGAMGSAVSLMTASWQAMLLRDGRWLIEHQAMAWTALVFALVTAGLLFILMQRGGNICGV